MGSSLQVWAILIFSSYTSSGWSVVGRGYSCEQEERQWTDTYIKWQQRQERHVSLYPASDYFHICCIWVLSNMIVKSSVYVLYKPAPMSPASYCPCPCPFGSHWVLFTVKDKHTLWFLAAWTLLTCTGFHPFFLSQVTETESSHWYKTYAVCFHSFTFTSVSLYHLSWYSH